MTIVTLVMPTRRVSALFPPVPWPGGEEDVVAWRPWRRRAGEPWAPAGVQGLWVSAKGAVDNDLVQGALKQGELLIVELGDEQL